MKIFLYSSALFAWVLPVFLCSTACANERDTLTIVCFGNSTTAPRKGLNKPYPVLLDENLQSSGIKATIFNAGVPGSHAGSRSENSFHKVAHALDRFDTAVMAKNPDWVILSFGTNDSWQDQGQGSPARISLDKFKQHLSHFIEKIQAAHGTAILMTPNPLGKKFEKYRHQQLKKYRNACLSVARKHSIEAVDAWGIFRRQSRNASNGNDDLLMDGMHPKDAGHALMAEAVLQIISKQYSND
jgi:lysophospholipase L1-like esterase